MLSQALYKYLKRNPRRFKMTREEILEAFARFNIPPLDLFVDFQLQFGGYWPCEDGTFGIVAPLDDQWEPRFGDDNSSEPIRIEFYVDCQIQIGFYLDENGQVYYDHLPVAETFESYLRHRCYLDANLNKDWKQIAQDRPSTKKFRKLLDKQEVQKVNEASDKFHSVKRNDGLILVDRGGHSVEVFVKPDIFYGKR